MHRTTLRTPVELTKPIFQRLASQHQCNPDYPPHPRKRRCSHASSSSFTLRLRDQGLLTFSFDSAFVPSTLCNLCLLPSCVLFLYQATKLTCFLFLLPSSPSSHASSFSCPPRTQRETLRPAPTLRQQPVKCSGCHIVPFWGR